jgi:hypothetical protein
MLQFILFIRHIVICIIYNLYAILFDFRFSCVDYLFIYCFFSLQTQSCMCATFAARRSRIARAFSAIDASTAPVRDIAARSAEEALRGATFSPLIDVPSGDDRRHNKRAVPTSTHLLPPLLLTPPLRLHRLNVAAAIGV